MYFFCFYRVVKDCFYVIYVVLFFLLDNLVDEMEVIRLVVEGIINVFEVCVKIKGGVKRVVLISFCVVVYGIIYIILMII